MSRYKYSKRAAEFNCSNIEFRESGYYVAIGDSGLTYHIEWQGAGMWHVRGANILLHTSESLIGCLEWIRTKESELAFNELVADKVDGKPEDYMQHTSPFKPKEETMNEEEEYQIADPKDELINHYRKTIRKLVAENKDLKRNYAHLQGVRDGLLLAQGLDERGK